jgi:hypothetical protein
VVCNCFDIFDALGIGDREVFVDRAKVFNIADVSVGELGQAKFAEGDEIFYLDAHAISNESVLREVLVKFFALAAIATVNRRDSSES